MYHSRRSSRPLKCKTPKLNLTHVARWHKVAYASGTRARCRHQYHHNLFCAFLLVCDHATPRNKVKVESMRFWLRASPISERASERVRAAPIPRKLASAPTHGGGPSESEGAGGSRGVYHLPECGGQLPGSAAARNSSLAAARNSNFQFKIPRELFFLIEI